MFLTPGDSPLGLRLPLESLPWTKPEDVNTPSRPILSARDKLPPRPEREAPFVHPAVPDNPSRPPKGQAQEGRNRRYVYPAGSLRTGTRRQAVCLHAAGGISRRLSRPGRRHRRHRRTSCMPVAIEGYTPPPDPRISVIKVTPDPGVIEVNIQPAAAGELVENTTELYELARRDASGNREVHAGRAAFRDRRRQPCRHRRHHSGGQRFSAPSRSAPQHGHYWQNHPSLSYLFSGLFIGPTSQHPRVDEARMDSLYELEIAFEQIPTGVEPRDIAAGRSPLPPPID